MLSYESPATGGCPSQPNLSFSKPSPKVSTKYSERILIMEPMTTFLGLAVGKAVFKAWFKDNEFASSASESVVDLVKSTVGDRRARGAAERQLNRISESASDALESYIEFEWGTLSTVEKSEAINVVQNCIDGLNINATLMAALDFNTDRLVALVMSRLEDGGLSSEGRRLAGTLAHEAAQMISDLASSLPEFHRDTFAEVLRREAELIVRLDRVFDEIRSIRESATKDSSSSAGTIFEQTYRRSLARELDKIELFGMDSGIRQSSRQHSLSTAYISLSVSGGGDVNPDSEESETDLDSDIPAEKKAAFSVRAEEAANFSNLVVIKGEAGSGKTTLLQSLAVRCATASYDGEMEPWNELIPFFIRLRALTGPNLPTPEELPGLVASIIAGTMPAGWVHQQLQAGRGLILIDGLDEVSTDRRDSTRNWISSILGEYPLSRVVVTSRPTAIPDGWLSQKGFRQLELLPMSPDDVAVFIDHWHEAVANEEQNADRRSTVKLLSPSLKERIRTDRALRELAGTPLLCAMLCAMNRDRNQVLPNNRIALYDAAVQMIMHGRDEERRIKVDSIIKLDLETKQGIVQEVAFWMMQNDASMADQWRIEDYVASLIPAFTKLSSSVTSKMIVTALIQRSGILRSPIEGKVDFVHNAFKEYLCAKAVTAGDRFGYLHSVLVSEAWREVAVLAAAMTDERRRASFIGGLLEAGDDEPAAKATYHLLAVRCLETCTQLDPVLQSSIKDRLTNMSAPNSLTEARSLSAAGELALPLLKRSKYSYARTAAACVRALRLIGTPEALNYIADYAPDGRATVAKEVIAAWPFFDTEEYARDILSLSYGIYGTMRIDHPHYLPMVKYFIRIAELIIVLRRSNIPDKVVSDINGLTNLVRFALYCDDDVDIRNYFGLTLLNGLSITARSIININDISHFTGLYRISISGESTQPLDLGNIPPMVDSVVLQGRGIQIAGRPVDGNIIDELNIVNDLPLDDLSYLTAMPYLDDLSLRYVSSLNEIQNIGKCSELHALRIFVISNIESLNGLEGLEKLNTLVIAKADDLADISAVAGLKGITILHIRRASNLININAISSLENLYELALDVNADANLDFASQLPKLRVLRLAGQHFESYGKPVNGLRVIRMTSHLSE